MKRNTVKLIVLLVGLLMTWFAQAICVQTQNSLTGLVGLDGKNGQIYADVQSDQKECSCTSVRFLSGNSDTKKALSILLAAKIADKKVRIDLQTSGDCNSAYRVYLN